MVLRLKRETSARISIVLAKIQALCENAIDKLTLIESMTELFRPGSVFELHQLWFARLRVFYLFQDLLDGMQATHGGWRIQNL
jgi:hypothetical protein